MITGGSGLIGTRLTEFLLGKGYQLAHLSRSRTSKKSVKSYIWDISRGFIEDGAVENANIVIHLAGANVGKGRWTSKRKDEILQSRVKTTRLLYDKLANMNTSCETVISNAAIGIYGLDTGDEWVNEETPAGDGFMAEVTKQWEREAARLKELKLRVVTLRTGVVLSDEGGALPRLANPIKLNIGAVLGSGRQYMSWIHIEDLCRIMYKAISDVDVAGTFNAVAPEPVTNKEFTKTLAQVLNKSLWLPAVPGWALRTALGEMAEMVLGGNRVSSRKIRNSGFKFKYEELLPALKDILGSNRDS